MHYRWITTGLPVVAVAIVVAACGTGSTGSEGAGSTPSHPGTSTITSSAAATTPTDSGTSTTPPSVPPGHGTGASAYAGTWQRHLSRLTLESDPKEVGTILIGASAADGEEWSLTWAPVDRGIVMTLDRLVNKSGAGLGGTLTAGQTIPAVLSADAANVTILQTTGIGDSTLTWCKSGASSPGCGA